MTRLALIHALAHSVAPINEELSRAWPEAVRMNLLDDSLSADLARSGTGLDAAMHQRFESLAAYAEGTGANAILFTCSAFGSCIEAVAARRPHMPVLKPNEAMVAEAVAVARGGRIGLVASFAPTLTSMPPEFPPGTQLVTRLAEGAMEALNRGDTAEHDALVVEAARWLADQGCDAIALAQFSMARAQMAVHRAVDLPVLTTPGSAVRMLRHRLGA
ncbi:aspartate/glutamate racemase family protein [Hydrogenophaga sp.]|uniref:aspartate/glutamate racemase family protein n=1 Tax=Hydrogenophaga sp. TaxID=1904254 RepID=UPI002FCB9DC0